MKLTFAVCASMLAALAAAQSSITPVDVPTFPPPATPTPTSTDPADAYSTLDILFHVFSEARVTKYQAMFATALTVKPARLQIVSQRGYSAIKFGTNFLLTMQVLPPTTLPDESEFSIAKRLEAYIAANATTDNTFVMATVYQGRRVQPEVRATESGSSTINLEWVALCLAGLALVLVSISLLLRHRSSVESQEEPDDVFDDIRFPKENPNETTQVLDTLLSEAHHGREMEAKRWRFDNEVLVAPINMFQAMLDYDKRLALPPMPGEKKKTPETEKPKESPRMEKSPEPVVIAGAPLPLNAATKSPQPNVTWEKEKSEAKLSPGLGKPPLLPRVKRKVQPPVEDPDPTL